MTSSLDIPAVVLIGPPGAGKTATGSLLARTWQVPFHDTDQAVQDASGRTISELFIDEGEAHFRMLERRVVAAALADEEGVVSLGGGAVLDANTQSDLARHTVVFLDVGIADAAPRVGFDQSRPLLMVNPRAQWISLMKARRPIYERLATVRVDTSGRVPEAVVAQILTLVPRPA